MQARRAALQRLLADQSSRIPRPARHLLNGIVADDALLSRMHFCCPDERPLLRNSLLISTDEVPCWAILLGNVPGSAARTRAKLVLQGLNLAPAEILERLRTLPVWFIAVDPPYAAPAPGIAAALERTVYQLARLSPFRLRTRAILDQIDAALDEGDLQTCRRLHGLLPRQA
ncbi:MAG TPA: hypothetical protein VD969_21785 [Symbiobacteriaceae bacterium]|nr:hypothetical protein [Symbiobacteriaceae bacterium]